MMLPKSGRQNFHKTVSGFPTVRSLFMGNTSCRHGKGVHNQLRTGFHAEPAAGKEHVIAFRLSPSRRGIGVKVALAHFINLADSFGRLFFVNAVAGGYPGKTVIYVRVDKRGKTAFVPQDLRCAEHFL